MYSESDQFKLAGHSRAPIHSWLKPLLLFTLQAEGGTIDWPLGVIQLRIEPFRLFVSSAWALEAPFSLIVISWVEIQIKSK